MTELSARVLLLDFVQCVLKRPSMYTEKGSYYEVAAFLKGYLSNLDKAHFSSAPWFEFLDWLQVRMGTGEGRLLIRFRDQFTGDTTAIQALYGLYEEFLQSDSVTENSPNQDWP